MASTISTSLVSVIRKALLKSSTASSYVDNACAAGDTLLATLHDHSLVSDELRAQLEGWSGQELADSARVVRRLLDCTLMCFSWILFACNYFDRVGEPLAQICVQG
jgi:hypothetical protein